MGRKTDKKDSIDEHRSMYIEMLGDFAIITEGRRIVESTRKSSKIWRLIEYLVAHRDKPVPQEELLDVFCKDEQKDNPGSILRTMIYRARTTLEECGLSYAHDVIVVKGGCYFWNKNIECATDAEEMEAYINQAETSTDDDEKLSLLLKAAELYKGDFLQKSSGEMWAIPLVRWYRNLYIGAVRKALDMLMQRSAFTQAEELSVKALGIDRFDEYFIMCYLRTLIAEGKHAQAHEVYKKMEEMFYDELGVDFSDELREVYGKIQHIGTNENAPLCEVVMDWLADMDIKHIYSCDQSIFIRLCQVEARSAQRSGHTTYIVRFDTKHEANTKAVARGSGVMNSLDRAIQRCLRSSDIYTRYSPSQYMVMLRSLTYEDCKMLVNKILGELEAKYLPQITDTSIMHLSQADINAG